MGKAKAVNAKAITEMYIPLFCLRKSKMEAAIDGIETNPYTIGMPIAAKPTAQAPGASGSVFAVYQGYQLSQPAANTMASEMDKYRATIVMYRFGRCQLDS